MTATSSIGGQPVLVEQLSGEYTYGMPQKRAAKVPTSTLGSKRKLTETRVAKYLEILGNALDNYEKEHPNWRTEALLWIVEFALYNLRRYIDSDKERDISWDSPFVELQYPVDVNWKAWGEGDHHNISIDSGKLTTENTRDKATTSKTLARILTKHITILALQDFTRQVAFEIRGSRYTPIVSPDVAQILADLKTRRKQGKLLEVLFRPFSMGASLIEFDESKFRPNKTVPKSMAKALAKMTQLIDLPALEFNGNIDGHKLKISLILQIHPLVVDLNKRAAHFPIVIGLLIIPAGTLDAEKLTRLMNERWANPANWSEEDRNSFWASLTRELKRVYETFAPQPAPEVTEAILTVNATVKVPVSHSDAKATNAIVKRMMNGFMKTGQLVQFDHEFRGPKELSVKGSGDISIPTEKAARLRLRMQKKRLEELTQAVDAGKTPDEKGRSLEELVAMLFGTIPGFVVNDRRVRTETEEIDIIVLNNSEDPRFKREQAVILIECKNWSSKCGKNEFADLSYKIRNRRGRCSLGFLISWNGFAGTITKEILRESHESTLIVPIDGMQIRDALRNGSFLKTVVSAWDKAIKT